TPVQLSKSPVRLGVKLQMGKITSAPVCERWARGSPSFRSVHPLPSPSTRGGWRADKAHGLDRQAGDGTACGRPWARSGTPRALRRANAASSAYASVSDRAAPGAVCPWQVFPEAARGSDCVTARPQGAAPDPRLANASGRRPSNLDRDELNIITLSVKSTTIC